jgi:hypothetical protein
MVMSRYLGGRLPRLRASVSRERGLAREPVQAMAVSELLAAVAIPVAGKAVGKETDVALVTYCG